MKMLNVYKYFNEAAGYITNSVWGSSVISASLKNLNRVGEIAGSIRGRPSASTVIS